MQRPADLQYGGLPTGGPSPRAVPRPAGEHAAPAAAAAAGRPRTGRGMAF
ncbi:hypothetical protein [Paracidovorax oryzae]|nr:hypothetical protein [Paracidovorax oryzae]